MTPVGHTIVGIWLGDIIEKKLTLTCLVFYSIIASLPDFDLVVGFMLYGKKGIKIHQLYTHNLLFVFIIVTITYILSRGDKRITIFVLLALLSHLFLDLLVIDKKPPIGIAPFYPFSSTSYNFPIFSGVEKSSLKALFSIHNLKAVFIEILVLSPLWIYLIHDLVKRGKDEKRWA